MQRAFQGVTNKKDRNMTQHKRRSSRLVYLGLLLIPIAISHAQDSLHALDTMVERWMQLRTTIASEKREWDVQKQQWQTEIDLLEKEYAALEKEIETASTFVSSVEQQRLSALEQKEKIENELQKLEVVLAQAEQELRLWQDRIPTGLRHYVKAFDMLPQTPQESARLPLTKRSQTVVATYAQIETLQNQMHATREMLDVDDGRRQVDVLYIGLSVAYAVSPANDWAAMGIPAEGTWEWRMINEHAENVREALNVFLRQESAKLVTLPMQTDSEVQP
jgi:vacuolar-type H+-ATPase subunit I/STV1